MIGPPKRPDVCFWKQEKAEQFTAEQMKLPAPELIVEVLSKGTAKRDRATSVGGVKFTDYAANGIGEYWIVNPGKQTVEQYELDPETEGYAHVKRTIAATKLLSNRSLDFGFLSWHSSTNKLIWKR